MTTPGPEEKKRLFIDRSLVFLFSKNAGRSSAALENLTRGAGNIFYDAGGASALERDLTAHREDGIRLIAVTSQDLLALQEAEKDGLNNFLRDAARDPAICAIIGQYAHRTMSLRFQPEDVLGYIVRLALFSLGLRADLACSSERAEMIRSIAAERGCLLDESGGQFQIDAGKLIGLSSAAPLLVAGFETRTGERGPANAKRQAPLGKKLFINYRRKDVGGFAHAIFAWLASEMSSDRIFFDVADAIPAGEVFPEALRQGVLDADIVLCLVGEQWLDLLKERVGGNADYVLIELELALGAGKKVVPVLIGNADMPRPEDLPETIRQLSIRHAIRIRAEAFRDGCFKLIENLRAAV